MQPWKLKQLACIQLCSDMKVSTQVKYLDRDFSVYIFKRLLYIFEYKPPYSEDFRSLNFSLLSDMLADRSIDNQILCHIQLHHNYHHYYHISHLQYSDIHVDSCRQNTPALKHISSFDHMKVIFNARPI